MCQALGALSYLALDPCSESRDTGIGEYAHVAFNLGYDSFINIVRRTCTFSQPHTDTCAPSRTEHPVRVGTFVFRIVVAEDWNRAADGS